MTIDWLQIAVNLCAVLGAVATFGMWYKSYIIDQVRLSMNSQVVLKTDYEKDMESMLAQIDQIRKFDAEFAVLKTKMDYVQRDTAEIKQQVSGLSAEITGAIKRAYESNR